MADAQANPAINFIVTFGHRPAYSTGNPGGDAALATILDDLGDTYSKYVLNLNGHAHDYERFAADPRRDAHHRRHGGGDSVEPPWRRPTRGPRSGRSTSRHLRVDVTATSLHIEAVCGPPTTRTTSRARTAR